ncbi:ImmA/IrrE family metallo-endopeptidase [Snodgrassella sp. CFCC 13594]|uniref:helix-turn-helix domain-containing protein n=1 Tax=Snodgrassella sp. CFCC 13594 TaxID=1775559 RepID=UPI000835EA69|nr:XRE family transcriptional regulator [Snodgrassella sp. CFCC 13594]
MKVGITDFIPEKLRIAREIRGYNQTQLEAISEVSKATISKWENGEQSPSFANLEKVSSALNFPMGWFIDSEEIQDNAAYFFRTLKRSTPVFRNIAKSKLLVASIIKEKLDNWLEFTPLDIPTDIYVENYNTLSSQDIENIANQCREYWQLGLAPISNMIELLESIGVVVVKDNLGSSDIDGVSNWFQNTPYVFLAADKENTPRSRFDAAHELAHIILHRNIPNNEYDYTVPNLKKNEKERLRKNYDLIEKQAHLFASAFLMPAESISYHLTYPSLEKLLVLKRKWKVSVMALIMRAGSLKLISDDKKAQLFKNYSARGWRTKGEPLDEVFLPEYPQLFSDAIDVLVSEGGLSVDGLKDIFNLSNQDISSLCNLPQGFFEKKSKIIRFRK